MNVVPCSVAKNGNKQIDEHIDADAYQVVAYYTVRYFCLLNLMIHFSSASSSLTLD